MENQALLKHNKQTLNLSEEFIFVANKNGHHDSLGYIFTNFKTKILKTGDHVSYIGKEILKFFEI
jgi:hypothetical protein